MIMVIAGSNEERHFLRVHIGMGSREEDLFADDIITLLTSSSDVMSKETKLAGV
jgi:hypothetical protein